MSLIQGESVRRGFLRAKRVLIKVGSNVLTNDEGRLAIGRIGELVEQIAKLVAQDRKEVILVSSGAVAVGSRRLSFQKRLSQTLLQTGQIKGPSARAAASAGQAMFMSLYEQMFAQFDLSVGNVLVTHSDFTSQEHVGTLAATIDELLESGIVPVINENDVTNQVLKDRPVWFKDNDSLSAKLASDFDAQLLLLLTDVPGVYTAAPGTKGAYLLDYYSPVIDKIQFGDKSSRGRGGMESKMHAAMLASQKGVDVVIASGSEPRIIERIFAGEVLGTVFTQKWDQQCLTPRQILKRAVDARASIQKATSECRKSILQKLVHLIRERADLIVEANKADLQTVALKSVRHRDSEEPDTRMVLTTDRVRELATTIEQLSKLDDPIGEVMSMKEVTAGLKLQQETVPLGVVLCVTEDVADVLGHIGALCVLTGNALIVYDHGSNLRRTNKCVLDIFLEAGRGTLPDTAIQFTGTETDLTRLLDQQGDDFLDVVLPRGAPPALVEKIRASGNVPVLGDRSATCHVYVDTAADMAKAMEVVVDSKLEDAGPGCTTGEIYASDNTMDVLLVHEDLLNDGRLLKIVRTLTDAKISIRGGPRAAKSLGFKESPSPLRDWHDRKKLMVEVVSGVGEAIDFINGNECGIADSVVTEDAAVAEAFLSNVDTACAFHNASTRFADGWRLGLGAETGLSTRRAYARGPVGVKGLLSSKWKVVSGTCHTYSQYLDGKWQFSHKDLFATEVVGKKGKTATPAATPATA